MLKVLEKAKKNQPLEISSTFLGAHSVPKGKRAEEATKDVIQNQVGSKKGYGLVHRHIKGRPLTQY